MIATVLANIILTLLALGFLAACVLLRREYEEQRLRFKAALDELMGTEVENLELKQRSHTQLATYQQLSKAYQLTREQLLEVCNTVAVEWEAAKAQTADLRKLQDILFDKFVWWHDRALEAEKRVAELEAERTTAQDGAQDHAVHLEAAVAAAKEEVEGVQSELNYWRARALSAGDENAERSTRVAELEASQQELQSALDAAQQEARMYKTRWQASVGLLDKPSRKKKGSK